MTHYKRITAHPLCGALGAQIDGVASLADADDETIAEIRAALLEHLVIFFRDQRLDVEQHKRLAQRFGDIFVHPNFNVGTGDPEIVNVIREPGDKAAIGDEWHTDTTMMAAPPMGAILYAIDTPPWGADTLFANQYLAWEGLSSGMRSMLEGLRAVHSDVRVAGPQAAMNAKRSNKVREDADWRATETLHPVAATHPETGRKSLFVNRSYTVRFEGMTAQESRPLLDYLFAHGARPEWTCRFAWRNGSVAFWDNRCTRHLALNDVPQFRRHMRRVQIAGTPVV